MCEQERLKKFSCNTHIVITSFANLPFVVMECLEPYFSAPSQITSPQATFVKPTSKAGAIQQSMLKRKQIDSSEVTRPRHVFDGCIGQVCELQSKATTASGHSASWWISRSTKLYSCHRNGWVVSLILEQYHRESQVASDLDKQTFQERAKQNGLETILTQGVQPRQRCKALLSASPNKLHLTTENAQRLTIKAIERSIPSYMSGLRCWASLCDAMGHQVHFPAKEGLVLYISGGHIGLCI